MIQLTWQTLTHTQYRLLGGEDSYKELSEFVALSSKKEPVCGSFAQFS